MLRVSWLLLLCPGEYHWRGEDNRATHMSADKKILNCCGNLMLKRSVACHGMMKQAPRLHVFPVIRMHYIDTVTKTIVGKGCAASLCCSVAG